MNAEQIIKVCGYQFLDEDNVRWTEEELLEYVPAAQLQIVHLKPDALSETVNIALQEGENLQELPNNAIRLLDVVRNVGGRSVVQTTLRAMNELYLEWPADSGSKVVRWMYTPENDRSRFYVYPRPQGSISLECVVAVRPKLSVTLTETLELEDQWYNQVIDYVLWRAYSKDADYGNVSRKAQHHLDSFYNALGLTFNSNINADTAAVIRGQDDALGVNERGRR